MEIVRSNQKHKPAKTIRVKRRVYVDFIEHMRLLETRNEILEERTILYSNLLRDLMNATTDEDLKESVKSETPELWND